MGEALVIRNLSKRFGGLQAVQDVSFSIQENETVALIGPNGAGKTTSFNLITGYHRPDSGSVSAFGREILGERVPVVEGALGGEDVDHRHGETPWRCCKGLI